MPNRLFPQRTDRPAPEVSASPEMTGRIGRFDWSTTPLGSLESWPEALRAATRTILCSPKPMVMLIGSDGVLIYNDGYARFAGARHPAILGLPAAEAFPEIADFNRNVLAFSFRGETLSLKDQELELNRNGTLESAWMNLDYSPLLGADGEPFGVLVIVDETTEQVRTQRALARSQEQLNFAFDASGIVGSWDWNIGTNSVKADARFAELYGVEPEAARQGVALDVFMDGIHADDRATVADAIQKAVEGTEELRVEYRVQPKQGGVRWVLALGRVARDETGAPTRLPGIVLDISDRRAQEALLSASEAKFRAIADSMPQMVWSTLPDGFHDYYNARWYEFTGMPMGSTDGEEWNGMFHPDDQARAWEVWRQSLETGEPYEIEYRLRHHSGEYRWTLGRALPIRDAEGRITRWMGTCTDIHETKIAAEEREVVAQELSHRIKNIFSVLTGIVSLSARAYPEAKQFAGELRQRIFAMGRAHDFVRPHSRASRPQAQQHSLKALVEQLVAPFESEEKSMRLSFTGDDAVIDEAAATPLALLFHELATNSAKYGAFSARDGRVTIEGRSQGDRYQLVWKEQGGPVVEASPREGFGTRLIALSVEGQLGGKLERAWEADGLRMQIDVPLAALSRSGRLQKTF